MFDSHLVTVILNFQYTTDHRDIYYTVHAYILMASRRNIYCLWAEGCVILDKE